MVTTCIIPACGDGRRFREQGYKNPKPMIDVLGKPMITAVMESLSINKDIFFVVVTQKRHKIPSTIFSNKIFGGEILEIDGLTGGAVDSVMRASEYIKYESPLLVANCDQIVLNGSIEYKSPYSKVFTFESTNPHHSYIRSDKSGNITEIKEKNVISRKAVLGIYYFLHGGVFKEHAQKVLNDKVTYKNEFYLSSVIQSIANGFPIFDSEIMANSKAILGTPEELEEFIQKAERGRWDDYNSELKKWRLD